MARFWGMMVDMSAVETTSAPSGAVCSTRDWMKEGSAGTRRIGLEEGSSVVCEGKGGLLKHATY